MIRYNDCGYNSEERPYWFVCQKCKRPAAPLVIVPKQLIILCEDCFLKYSKIFSVEDREFVLSDLHSWVKDPDRVR